MTKKVLITLEQLVEICEEYTGDYHGISLEGFYNDKSPAHKWFDAQPDITAVIYSTSSELTGKFADAVIFDDIHKIE